MGLRTGSDLKIVGTSALSSIALSFCPCYTSHVTSLLATQVSHSWDHYSLLAIIRASVIEATLVVLLALLPVVVYVYVDSDGYAPASGSCYFGIPLSFPLRLGSQ